MKKILGISILALGTSLFSIAQTGTWTALANQAPDPSNGCLLLLTDGSVLFSSSNGNGYGTAWDRLTPDASGSYVNGTWTQIAQMNYDRFAFSSQVLPSGKVYVAGGEYGTGGQYGEVYDPVANTWTVCGNIPNGWNIYDAPSELLYTGNVLEGPEIGANGGQPCNSILQWNPASLNYINENEEPGNHDEAAWLKLPDSSVITASMPVSQSNSNPAQDSVFRFIPQTNSWFTDNLTPNNLYDQWGFEAGGAYLLPNGKAIFFGATQYNCIYTPAGNTHTKGTWSSAANFPTISSNIVSQPDAPGTEMVNGHILLCVSPEPTGSNEFNSPSYFIEYDYTTNTFTQVTATIPTIGADNFNRCVSQNQGFLELPDGTVLMCSNAYSRNPTQCWVYTPGSAAIAQGKPTINSVTTTNCTTFMVTGKLFNGISEANGYGDDVQNSTNFPLVRLTDGTNVYYATTTDWNRIGAVATDSLEDTAYFTLPTIPAGTYSLVVVANGFASNPTIMKLPCVLTDVPNAIESSSITVYPNPNNGVFTVESSAPFKSIIRVYNLVGQQIMSQTLTSSKNQLNLSSQPAGVYYYRVLTETGGLITNGKVVIQK